MQTTTATTRRVLDHASDLSTSPLWNVRQPEPTRVEVDRSDDRGGYTITVAKDGTCRIAWESIHTAGRRHRVTAAAFLHNARG